MKRDLIYVQGFYFTLVMALEKRAVHSWHMCISFHIFRPVLKMHIQGDPLIGAQLEGLSRRQYKTTK